MPLLGSPRRRDVGFEGRNVLLHGFELQVGLEQDVVAVGHRLFGEVFYFVVDVEANSREARLS